MIYAIHMLFLLRHRNIPRNNDENKNGERKITITGLVHGQARQPIRR